MALFHHKTECQGYQERSLSSICKLHPSYEGGNIVKRTTLLYPALGTAALVVLMFASSRTVLAQTPPAGLPVTAGPEAGSELVGTATAGPDVMPTGPVAEGTPVGETPGPTATAVRFSDV